MAKRAYRITERIMADNTYQFVPEACDNKREENSLWDRIFQTLDPEKWYSVADALHVINDSGYKTYELALERFTLFMLQNPEQPQPVKVLRIIIHDVKL